PRPGTTTPEDAASGLELGARAPAGRPYMVLNMVASLDGKATVEGRTRQLGSEADRLLFHHLRTQADALLVGAGTVRTERYGRAVKSPELRAKREEEGLDPALLTVVVSGRLDLTADLPLLQDPESRVVIATAAEHDLTGTRAQIDYLRTGDDLPLLLARLRDERGVRSVLCEGGPTLNSHLLAAGLVDELFLSFSPSLVGGTEALTIVAGRPLLEPAGAELVWLLEGKGDLFSRWRIAHS
ncbi:MAG: dihydrofolate reductase family protein, partial [Actinomycetota bacterium]|nr:dihydrofolate reductase family protein [Actinomycetota bacterium]